MQWIGVVGVIFGLVAGAAALLVYVRGNLAKGTIDLLQQNQEAQDKAIVILRAENASLMARVEALEKVNTTLFEQIKSIPAFADMAKAMTGIERRMDILIDAMKDLSERQEEMLRG